MNLRVFVSRLAPSYSAPDRTNASPNQPIAKAPKQTEREKNAALLRRDRDLQDHLKALGLESVEQYIFWCANHGFSQKVQKNWKSRCKERFHDKQHTIESRLRLRKLERRRPVEVIEKIFAGELTVDDLATPWLKRVLQTAQDLCLTEHREAFRELIVRVCEEKSGMLSVRTAHPKADAESNSFIDGLATLAKAKGNWNRELNGWKPRVKRPQKQFASLARHLVAKYDVPEFLDCVWFVNDPVDAKEQVGWFLKLGNGVSLRKIGLPISLSKSMVKHFIGTPYGHTVIEAIRRAQILSLGGNKQLVEPIIATRLGTNTLNNEYWMSVMKWLIQNPPNSSRMIGPLIDFFRNEKFPNGDELASPTDYAVKGRSLSAVMRELSRWHVALRTTTSMANLTWPPDPAIVGFEFSETNLVSGQQLDWKIEQLLSIEELRQEGRAMKHCVLSYGRSCVKNETTIWSLKLSRDGRKERRVITIEVGPASRRIVQIRGKHNRLPRPNERAVISRWASQEGLV